MERAVRGVSAAMARGGWAEPRGLWRCDAMIPAAAEGRGLTSAGVEATMAGSPMRAVSSADLRETLASYRHKLIISSAEKGLL